MKDEPATSGFRGPARAPSFLVFRMGFTDVISNIKKMISQRRARENLYNSADYWNSKAKDYAGDAVSMWPNNHLNRLYHAEQLAFVESIFPEVTALEVLDLGCGTGRMSRWFAHRGATVVGLDFSQGALDIARSLSDGPNPSYRCQSVFDIDDNAAFDVVVCWGCVTVACQNREQLSEVLANLHGAIRPGGRLVFLEPIHKGLLHRVLNMGVSEFLESMRAAGFDVQRVEALHFWPVRLFLAYLPWPRWITRPIYGLGQGLMRLPGLRNLGDYRGIAGTRR